MMLIYGTLRPLHGKGYPGAKKMVGSAVFLKLVRPLVFSDPACAENRVVLIKRAAYLWDSWAFKWERLPGCGKKW